MVDAIDKFLQSATKLREHLEGIEQKMAALDDAYILPCVTQPLKNEIDNIRNKQTDEKIFNYSVTIISLYGYYETFVEALIREYVYELSKTGLQFSSIPTKLKKSFFKKSIRLSGKITWEKFKHINEKAISMSLYESLNQDKQNIIPEAFFTNAGNYKLSVLCSCLGELGIEQVAQMVFKYPDLNQQLNNEYGTGVNLNGIPTYQLYSKIDEVVDRRNVIAHGAKVDNILDIAMLKGYIDFFISFAKSLNQYVNDTLLEMVWNIIPNQEMHPYNYLPRINVLCFRGYDVEFRKGQKYLCKTPQGTYPSFIEDGIVSMQQNHSEYLHFRLNQADPVGVAIKINHISNVNYKFKLR